MRPRSRGAPSRLCRRRRVLARAGDKWSVLIVMMLAGGPRRFSELERMIDGISQRMPTLTLRGLERSLQRPVVALGRWADDNRPAIDAARARYDAEPR